MCPALCQKQGSCSSELHSLMGEKHLSMDNGSLVTRVVTDSGDLDTWKALNYTLPGERKF